jgi:hypothetical protein
MKCLFTTPTIILLCAFPGFSQSIPTKGPDKIASMVRDIIRNQRSMDGRFVDYTSTVKTFTRWYNRKGKLTSCDTETYEHYPALPKSVVIQVEKNGSIVPSSVVAKERERGLQTMNRYLQSLKGANRNGYAENSPGFRLSLGVYPFLRNSDIYEAGQDTLDGRPMVTLKFRPKAGWTDPKGLVHKLSGMLWIDAQDKVVALARAWPATKSSADGLFFEMYHKKVFNDAWALVYYRLNPALDPDTFLKERFDWSFENSNFQRFTVEEGTVTRMAE